MITLENIRIELFNLILVIIFLTAMNVFIPVYAVVIAFVIGTFWLNKQIDRIGTNGWSLFLQTLLLAFLGYFLLFFTGKFLCNILNSAIPMCDPLLFKFLIRGESIALISPWLYLGILYLIKFIRKKSIREN